MSSISGAGNGGGNLTVINGTGSLTALPERLAISWTADQPVPADAVKALPAAIHAAKLALEPIAPRELMVLLVQSLKLWRLPDDWAEIAPFYREALEDMPADLVNSALKHCRQTLKWFPKPAELREPVLLELSRRQGLLRRLRAMEQKARLGDVAPPALKAVRSPAETAAAEAATQQARAVLDNTTLKRVPGYSEDRKQRVPVAVADAYAATEAALAARRAMKADAVTASETAQTRSVDADAPDGAA